jgi:hypothetical protein
VTRRRPRTVADLLGLSSPLGRWGFTVLALFSYAVGLVKPCFLCGVVALYAWKNAR